MEPNSLKPPVNGSRHPRVLVLFGAIPLYGQERANIQVFDELRHEGIESHFLTNARFGDLWIHPELDRLGLPRTPAPFGLPPRRGMGLRGIAALVRDIIGTHIAFFRALRAFRPTHVHVMNISYLLFVTPAIFFLRLPLIYRIGDAPPRANMVQRWLWKRLGRRCTRLVSNARFVRDLCGRSGFPEEKMQHIYSAAPALEGGGDGPWRFERHENDDAGQPTEFIELAREPGTLTLLYCGQLTKPKGVHLLVSAALKLLGEGRRLRLLLAGNFRCRNPFAEELAARVSESGFGESIRFLGFIRNSRDLFRLADVHVCPSLWDEPLSNSVLEAKGAAVPSIVFPRGGLVETVRHGVDGWICARQSTQGIGEAIRFYLDHPDERFRHGRAAAESALPDARFGVARFRREWAEVFRNHSAGPCARS
jgi:glycosyltransferase involved in cell wall biosynthesis